MTPPVTPQRRLPLAHSPPLEASLPPDALRAAQTKAQAPAMQPGATLIEAGSRDYIQIILNEHPG
jgi:hypothetical protein